MRLIGQLDTEDQAFALSSFLTGQGIPSRYDKSAKGAFDIWVIDEESYKEALGFYERYLKNPVDPIFSSAQKVQPEVLGPEKENFRPKGFKVRVHLRPGMPRFSFTLTNFLIAICVVLFMFSWKQEAPLAEKEGLFAVELGLQPIQKTLMFDFPYKMEKLDKLLEKHPLQELKDLKKEPIEVQKEFEVVDAIPMWPGILPLLLDWQKTGRTYLHQAPLFEKIRQGEVWRLITPVLLHANFLHILFNMLWLLLLGKQMENRIGKGKMLLAILLMGVISNIAQYLMTGPFFLGFSGIVVGMAGFIWMRQKVAPWEGYSIQRGTFVFLFLFLVAMVGLDLFSIALQLFHVSSPIPNIANTAHIVGGLVGLGLSRIPFFSRCSK